MSIAKWEDLYDIEPSLNKRGEKVYDIYRKGTKEMLWADVAVENIDDFLKGMVSMAEQILEEEFDAIFTDEPKDPK